MYKLQPAPERRYVFSASTRIAAGARDLSPRNVSTAQTRPQNSKASFAHQHPCGLKSALRRSRGDHAQDVPGLFPVSFFGALLCRKFDEARQTRHSAVFYLFGCSRDCATTDAGSFLKE